MKRPSFKLILSLTLVAVFFILVNRYFLHDAVNELAASLIKKPAVALFRQFNKARSFTDALKNWKQLAKDNEQIRSKNADLTYELLKLEAIKDENLFLKKALNLPTPANAQLIYGGIYSFNFDPPGYSLLLNLGSASGVNVGDIVVNGEGVLVGQIKEVFKNYSRINFVTDPMFRVAAKARGSKTQGIANGASQDGLYLNLVTNAEEIKEGDIIVTNGSDIFPAALIIGTVEHIEINESRIFKKIRVKPAADGYSLGKVIVIKNNAHQ
ncbi:MAG: rod shape-determining protein MreC [Candidatus Yanofskybacteria bacterium RIFCSPHIGHO2_01_FULL_45_42]|uniref:Cell shape-determining protein MreC n=3 Tax=Candidatus Yanofskyibacteriota TaxID=1752733 RepID=A0A1F8H1Z6_9BACT|nr:MAG: rod shape-determining protein MreC [Candidatus Yanofskybacteria bacterium RIFCSPHIGHO2_01_FULL_45_42]OGN15786.1 MAG: rod shape-determining protein MreC [Candidatus Yanofskybacteria bacterium RIFCSPHIGHO2_02_FULL_46_19]OGN26954.1 MAG: rod shape-determining protein MreC [Candidatus Yanofskybacteria bacterium RIFCSPLOWO2_01_FULL_45_72]OGN31561.1 MAG: rod shape-determining protein MreC [Candidatus Yanofskybacteria bacterium RIFCSPLOWO2_02_FULL_45_18]